MKNIPHQLLIASTLGVAAALGGLAATYAAPPAASQKEIKDVGGTRAVVPPSTQTHFVDNTPLTEDQKVVHLLNRIGYGPRPGDVARVKAMGLSAYLEQQLHPEKIADPAVDAKLSGFSMLGESGAQLEDQYKAGLKRGKELQRIRGTIEARMKGTTTGAPATAAPAAAAPGATGADMTAVLPPPGTPGFLVALYKNATPEERDQIKELVAQTGDKSGRRQAIQSADRELSVAKAVRAAESNRQLYEVMCDFWSNHFNIDIRKGQCRTLKVADERDVIRAHALGKFRDLLGASAHSPAMLFYLDNASNVAPQPDNPRFVRAKQQRLDTIAALPQNANNPVAQTVIANARAKQGLNENYGREIMELHTLGVDGGYTQKDVTEVARCFTGWGIGNDRNGSAGAFFFYPRRHDNGEKTVLGQVIPANGGERDGEKVLDILASRPATMRFVSTALCRRLVSDTPPPALVDRCVETWKRSDGDISEIVRTIVLSPEFNSRVAYRQKIKSPFEYAVSSVRALGGTFDLTPAALQRARYNVKNGDGDFFSIAQGRTLVGQVATMGEPLYQYQAPTGYSEDSRHWVSTGALISRLNFALGLVRGNLIEVQFPDAATPNASDPAGIVNAVTAELLQGDVAPSTRATLLRQANLDVADNSPAAGQTLQKRLVALTLGAPEFQRR